MTVQKLTPYKTLYKNQQHQASWAELSDSGQGQAGVGFEIALYLVCVGFYPTVGFHIILLLQILEKLQFNAALQSAVCPALLHTAHTDKTNRMLSSIDVYRAAEEMTLSPIS